MSLRAVDLSVNRLGRIGGRPRVVRDAPTALLYEHALRRGEGQLASTGALVVETGEHTGRSPKDKFIVREQPSEDEVWWGEVNRAMTPAAFAVLKNEVIASLGRQDQFVQNLFAGADSAYRLRLRVVSEQAWPALFSRNLFIVPEADGQIADASPEPDFTVLHAPSFRADPERHGTASPTVVAISFTQRVVVIAGTQYAGEIKKSIFTVLQYLLPRQGIATMHCSANVGAAGDVALFFGLSGTGKTTLSTDPERSLIGDDEHGWIDRGVFNFEGGCYAKVINLSAEAEPDIFRASQRFGTVLENVVLDQRTRRPCWDDASLTENARAAFPISYIARAKVDGLGDHPRSIILLSADAFGVLPPVARLSVEQAIYWFLSGYTSKLAGTERGLGEPEATFSACFGAPFLPLPPVRYAELLGERLRQHRPALWLVNTGWSGGPYGIGTRMPIALTRRIVAAVLDGSLATMPSRQDRLFGFRVPEVCPGVPETMLTPRQTWDNPSAYDDTALRLARGLSANFEQFRAHVPPAVAAAGPLLSEADRPPAG